MDRRSRFDRGPCRLDSGHLSGRREGFRLTAIEPLCLFELLKSDLSRFGTERTAHST